MCFVPTQKIGSALIKTVHTGSARCQISSLGRKSEEPDQFGKSDFSDGWFLLSRLVWLEDFVRVKASSQENSKSFFQES